MKKKILVVDDEPDFLEMVKMRLEANKYEVVTAVNGKEALKKIKEERPAAVLLDILMPQLDGLETLKRIRRQDKNLPVFMISAFSNEERFKVARQLKASGFIVKTSDVKEQLQTIASAIRLAEKYRAL